MSPYFFAFLRGPRAEPLVDFFALILRTNAKGLPHTGPIGAA